LAAFSVTVASVADNPAICGDDDTSEASGPCSGSSDHREDPSAPQHQCTLCPCRTPSVAPRVAPALQPIVLVEEQPSAQVLIPASLDAPAPPTPPPSTTLA
jgi:hypothetical protein